MSNTKQPPVELVEKMKNVSILMLSSEAEQCAQIAVDFAEEWQERYNVQRAVITELQKQNRELNNKCDELTDCLRSSLSRFKELQNEFHPAFVAKNVNEIQQLLNK